MKKQVLNIFLLVIIEQINAAENNPDKIQYTISIGNTTFNDFILSYPSGKIKRIVTQPLH